MTAEAIATDTVVPGAVRIAPRAMQHAVRAAAAEAFGAPASEVRATIVPKGAGIEVQLQTPVRIAALPIVEAAESARQRVIAETARITGATLEGCTLRITGCVQAEEPRAL